MIDSILLGAKGLKITYLQLLFWVPYLSFIGTFNDTALGQQFKSVIALK